MQALLGEMQKREKLLIPLTPKRGSVHFWLEENEKSVVAAMEPHLEEPLQVETYGEIFSAGMGFGRMANTRRIRMSRTQGGIVGKERFAQKDVVRGTLGFWESTSAGNPPTYIPRVFIADSGVFPEETYISSIQEAELLVSGGKPMDENHPDVKVLRTDPILTKKDFIIAALVEFSKNHQGSPFVLRFDTFRPWAGLKPRHHP